MYVCLCVCVCVYIFDYKSSQMKLLPYTHTHKHRFSPPFTYLTVGKTSVRIPCQALHDHGRHRLLVDILLGGEAAEDTVIREGLGAFFHASASNCDLPLLSVSGDDGDQSSFVLISRGGTDTARHLYIGASAAATTAAAGCIHGFWFLVWGAVCVCVCV